MDTARSYRTPATILDLAARLVTAVIVEDERGPEVIGRLRLPDGALTGFRSRSPELAAMVAGEIH